MASSSGDNVDRISQLPDSLLHDILSSHSLDNVVQTSVLSKRWRYVWHSFPSIVFDGILYSSRREKQILQSLERIMRNRHMDLIRIHEFTLNVRLSNDPEFKSCINQCLCYAVSCNVEKLKVKFHCYDRRYNLPQTVFFANSLQVLVLENCNVQLPRSNVTFSSLRRLRLANVYADDQVVKNLIVACPSVEYMDIFQCQGFKSLEVFSLSKLEEFKVENLHELERVYIGGVNVRLVEVTGLHMLGDIDVTLCKNLKQLVLGRLSISDKWLRKQIHKLPILECLDIIDCMNLRNIKISSLSLKKLWVINYVRELVDFKINTPNLQTVNYWGYMISFSSSSSLALSEARLIFYVDDVNNEWYVRLIEILAKFNNFSQVLKLQCSTSESMILPLELRQSLRSPLTCDKHVYLFISAEFVRFSLGNLVDGMLWISPHAETLSIGYSHGSMYKFSFKFSYKKPLTCEGETPCCCKSLPLSCWQLCIKDVEIEHTKGDAGEIVYTRSYSFEGEEILEKIDEVWTSVMEQFHDGDDGDNDDSEYTGESDDDSIEESDDDDIESSDNDNINGFDDGIIDDFEDDNVKGYGFDDDNVDGFDDNN